jgi:hypothetical protein
MTMKTTTQHLSLFYFGKRCLLDQTAACPEVKRVLTPTSQESQDEVMCVWSVCDPQGSKVQGPLVRPE